MNEIRTFGEWEKVLAESKGGPVVLYKHGASCASCNAAFRELSEGVTYKEIVRPVYYLVAQESRELSDKIAEDLMLPHQTPQAIIIMNERACYRTYADEISAADIAAKIIMISQAFSELYGDIEGK